MFCSSIIIKGVRAMNDNTYRLCKVTLMGIFVLGTLFIGYRASQTGRYVQYDVRKTCTQDGRSRFLQDYVIDTWSGARIPNG